MNNNVPEKISTMIEELMWQGLDTKDIAWRLVGFFKIEMSDAKKYIDQVIFQKV